MIRREIPTRRLETLTDVLSKVEEILRREYLQSGGRGDILL